MLKTLYGKLALALAALLTAIGVLYLFISTSTTHSYQQEVDQRFNRDLARNLVADRNLVQQGRLNEAALKATFKMYMVINPSIEIYLLDRNGTILSHSLEPEWVKRTKVSLGPVRAFLSGEDAFPLLGDDPRDPQGLKAFSVTPVPSLESMEGYLYVVLRGEQYDTLEQEIRDRYIQRMSQLAVAASLTFGLLSGLLIFHALTRRLRRLSAVMDEFQHSQFKSALRFEESKRESGDEVDQLGRNFVEMADRIRRQIEQLESQDAQRRQLVAQVSHDLRTPLAILQGYLETLKLKDRQLSEDDRKRHLNVALRQSERLTHLVGELFDLARLDAKETLPEREPFQLSELVHDVAQKFRMRFDLDQRGVRLDLDIAEQLPFVLGDLALTERVLDNLIENAADFTPRGEAVTISLDIDGDHAVVRISDKGPGIPEQDRQLVFEPFFQAEPSRNNGGHSGLGLAIAKRILDLQEGRIWVESTAGKGSTFGFTLPLAAIAS